MEVFHLHKLIKDKDDKIMELKQMFNDIIGDNTEAIERFATHIEENWKEYDSDNSATQWNLPDQPKRQKKGTPHSPQGSQQGDKTKPEDEDEAPPVDLKSMAPLDKFSYLLTERLVTKQEQLEKYQ